MLNVGRFMPQKAQGDFLKIAARTAKELPSLRFFLLGEGSLKADLEREVSELGLQDRVTFLPFRKDTEKIYGAADILLHTAHWDPLANVLLEGMAASLPVIATAVDGTAAVIFGGRTGRLFPKGAVERGAAVLLELARDPALRLRLGENARKFVEENHSVDGVVRQYKQLFSTLTGRDHA